MDGHQLDRPLGLPLPNHLLNPGIGSAVKPSREQWVRKTEGKGQESGGQKSGKRRAKARKTEGNGWESGGQKSGKRRAKVGKAEGKGRESGGQRSGKRSVKQRQTFCLTVQVCANGYCAETAVLYCHVLYVFVSQANRSLFLCSDHRSMTLRLQVCDATAGAKTASL